MSTFAQFSTGAALPTLLVDGMPFVSIGGELHNSSSSHAGWLETRWDDLATAGVNSVIASVAWDEVEPEEGCFDFAIVDELLAAARARRIKLVLIWFGAFKNGASTYAPRWVRADTDRFPRAARAAIPIPVPGEYEGATPKPVLSAFSAALREADARAFRAFAEHLAAAGAADIVIMLQVENEVGLLGSSRDHCEPAARAWTAPIPSELRALAADRIAAFPGAVGAGIATSAPDASWAEVFGADDTDADESFMAWGFARYVQAVAAQAAEVFPVPMFTNAWLGPQPGQPDPGYYPSGGPATRVIEVWRTCAPALSFVSPDVYIDDAAPVFADYAARAGALFVPESKPLAGDLFLAVGEHGALGYHAFGVDDLRSDAHYFAGARMLHALIPQIHTARERFAVRGAVATGSEVCTLGFDELTVSLRDGRAMLRTLLLDIGVVVPAPEPPASQGRPGAPPTPADDRAFGVVVRTAPDTFVVAGQGLFVDVSAPGEIVEIDRVRELVLRGGELVPARYLNGDERLRVLPDTEVGAVEIRVLRRPV